MLRIRDYKNFCDCMGVIHDGFYIQLHPDFVHETNRRLEILKLNNPDLYSQWLERWKSTQCHDRQ